jgi:4'-phosphopantetheinyl transferase EntD
MDAASLADFLGAKLSAGAHPNTMRKYLARLRARYRREHQAGRICAETLLDVLSVKPPRESSRRSRACSANCSSSTVFVRSRGYNQR